MAIAVNAVASGAADYVLFHRALHNPPGRYHANPMREVRGWQQWTAPQGFFGPLAMIALPYNEYLQRFGASRESMAAVAVEARKNGARIPWSYWHDRPLGAEEYLSAPMLFDPVCRYDCDIPVDGVATFVLTSADRAKDLPHPPVYVAGYAAGAPTRRRLPLHWPLDDIVDGGIVWLNSFGSTPASPPADVDLPQVYDGFSLFVWCGWRCSGFARPGRLIASSRRAASTATAPAGYRRFRVAAPWATGACTEFRRCSSAICSWPGGPVTGSAATRPSAWRAIPRRISVARSHIAPPNSESCVLLMARISFY